jgi:hypothetical protein
VVNRGLVAAINALPRLTFANDRGVDAGRRVGPLDFVVVGGDVVNREELNETTEVQVQSAAASWAQFKADYIDGITTTDHAGARTPLFIVPGNHEVSNALGFYHHMQPPTDNTAMVEIYNRMMPRSAWKTTDTYDYATDKVWTTRDLGGVHFMFLNVWPDSRTRLWMDADLTLVPSTTPVVIFTHDQPDVESKHFINPNPGHDINEHDKFENLLSDEFADGPVTDLSSAIEQRELERFIHDHPNITAYFHGNSNWNQFYDWAGPDRTIALHTFRVDSPMKGATSSIDETKLSFQLATIDVRSGTMTVRECLWNENPTAREPGVTWGSVRTIQLRARELAR